MSINRKNYHDRYIFNKSPIFQTEMKKEIHYMLLRTAALLLTDKRSYESPINNHVSFKDSGTPDTSVIPFIPMLLSANIIRLWESFKTDVINIATCHIQGLSDKKSIRPNQIDWSKTCEKFSQGQKKYILRKRGAIKNNRDWKLIKKIVQEYYLHICTLNEFFNGLGRKIPESFLQITNKLKNLQSQFNKQMDNLSKIDRHFFWKDVDDLKILKNFFLNLVKSDPDFICENYKKYLDYSNKTFDLILNCSYICEIPLKWRCTYLEYEAGLGIGKDFIVSPSTSPPRLYELWCFFEIVNMISLKRSMNIAQNCFICPHQNLQLFSMNETERFFYNYRGEKQSIPTFCANRSTLHSKVLKYTCVEWFMEIGNGTRVVFDTKYKPWSSIDNLQVLGYMEDFNAHIGVIVFPRELKSDMYSNPIIISEKIIKINLNHGKKFFALSLTPSDECKIENEQTLEKFLEHIFE